MKDSYYGDTVPEDHTVVSWPESQNYMRTNWFHEHARLINGEKLLDKYGGSSYIIPDWVIEIQNLTISDL